MSHRSHAKISEGVGHDILAIRGGGGAMRPPEGPKGAGESRDGAPEAPSGAPSEAAVGGSWAPNLLLFGSPKPPKSHLGCVLGVSCGGFGASWGLLSASWALLGHPMVMDMESFFGHERAFCKAYIYRQYPGPKRLLARIGGHLGGCELVAHAGRGARIKSLTNHLSCQNTLSNHLRTQNTSWWRLGSLLGRLGCILGRLGGLFGASWAVLG